MKSFRLWLESSDYIDMDNVVGDYVTPDNIWSHPNSDTFVFADGSLYLASETPPRYYRRLTHLDMYSLIPELKALVSSDVEGYRFRRSIGEEKFLLGRVAFMNWRDFYERCLAKIDGKYLKPWSYDGEVNLICLWTRSKSLLDDNLRKCVDELVRSDKFKKGLPTFVSVPLYGVVNVNKIINNDVVVRNLSPEERERIKMMERLHLAVGHEKRMLMDKLGLGYEKSSSKGVWRDAMRSMGMSGYLTQSESFDGDLDQVHSLKGINDIPDLPCIGNFNS